MKTSLPRHDWLNRWPLVIEPPAPLPTLEVRAGTETSNPLLTWLVLWATSLHPVPKSPH